MLNDEPNGIPPLPPDLSRADWQQVLLASYDDFCARVDAAESNATDTLFDPYAAENPGEFFAVMSEAFFETPATLHAEYPALYAQLASFYRQDPALRPVACPVGQ